MSFRTAARILLTCSILHVLPAMNAESQPPKTIKNTSDRYADIISQLNGHIEAFNAFLSKECHLKKISSDDPETYSDRIRGMPWGQQKYPSCAGSPGIYVLCGPYDKDPACLAVYIGKASCSSSIGKRLWAHLNPSRLKAKSQGITFQGDYRYGQHPNSFIIEVILAVPTPKTPSMAPALEEYITAAGLTGVQIFNANGRLSKTMP